MRHVAIAVLGAAAALGAGCSSWSIKSDYDHQAAFGRYRTFTWLAPPVGSREAGLVNTLLDQRLKSETERDLAEKGIRVATEGETPDFQVAYHVATREKIEATDWGYAGGPYMGPGYMGGAGMTVSSYTEGTLVLDFIDNRTRRVFWRGAASRPVEDPASAATRVGEAVDRMLQQYPPKGYAAAARPAG